MQNEFHFKLRNDQLSKYLMQSRAMHIMAAILLIVYGLPFLRNFSDEWIMVLGVFLPSITVLLVSIFKSSLLRDANNNRVFRILEAGFLLMGSMHYLQTSNNMAALFFAFVACVMLVLLWMESRILHDQFAVFTPAVIELELPFTTKKYRWNEVQQVVLKNEYLTLTFKENRYTQVGIYPNFTEEEKIDFEFFCQAWVGSRGDRGPQTTDDGR